MYLYTSYLSSATLSGQLIGIDVRNGLIDLYENKVVQRYSVSKIVGPVYVTDKRYATISHYISSLITTSSNNLQDIKNNVKLQPKSQSPAHAHQWQQKQATTEQVQPRTPVKQKSPSATPSSQASPSTNDSEQESTSQQKKVLSKSRQLRLKKRRMQRKPTDSKVLVNIKPLKTNVLKGFVRESDETSDKSSTASKPSSDDCKTYSLRSYWDVIERRGSPTGKTNSEHYADLRVAEFDKKVDRLVTVVTDLCTAVNATIAPAPALTVSQSSTKVEQRPPSTLQFREKVLLKRSKPVPDYVALLGRFESYTKERFIKEFKAAQPLDVVIDFTVYLCLSFSEATARNFQHGCRHITSTTKPGESTACAVFNRFRAALV